MEPIDDSLDGAAICTHLVHHENMAHRIWIRRKISFITDIAIQVNYTGNPLCEAAPDAPLDAFGFGF